MGTWGIGERIQSFESFVHIQDFPELLHCYKERSILVPILPKNTARWRIEFKNHEIHEIYKKHKKSRNSQKHKKSQKSQKSRN